MRFAPGKAAAELERISAALRETVLGDLRRHGAVVGLSGGVDSSVVAALCARALGPERVLGVYMNEAESAPETARLGRLAATATGISTV
ncbi:MAG TPA: asparagine synthase-related protein, partial [Kofleriaceae bacterium]|nr:asparagine synthase-related protein [Kofleriaceae bacterium]